MEENNKCLTPCDDDMSIMTVLEAIECSILNYQEDDIASVNVLRSGNGGEKYHMVITTTHGKFDLQIDDMRFDKDVNAQFAYNIRCVDDEVLPNYVDKESVSISLDGIEEIDAYALHIISYTEAHNMLKIAIESFRRMENCNAYWDANQKTMKFSIDNVEFSVPNYSIDEQPPMTPKSSDSKFLQQLESEIMQKAEKAIPECIAKMVALFRKEMAKKEAKSQQKNE